uniref:OCEL domain-containing protein n=1 Tax=Strigamia maritima TaxID=126957 RepID=T1IUD5_STRMM
TLKFPSSQIASEHAAFDFTFSPSSESEGLQGSFECVKKIGPSTKVIKASGPYMSRKVNVKKPFTAVRPKPAATSPPYSSYSKSYSSGSVSKPIVSNGHHHINNNTNNSTSFHTINKIPPPPVNRNKSLGNPDIMRRTLRERIIHLLAVHSYKKPELILRLKKDGIKEKDKKGLAGILTQVAIMKNNKFDLAKHVWSEVQDDWPFYTEADRQLLKERMSQNSNSPNSNEFSSSNSSPPLPVKRPNPDPGSIPSKKQRISHFNKQPEVNPIQKIQKHDGTNDCSQDSVNSSTKSDLYEFKRTVSTGFLPQNGYASTPGDKNGYANNGGDKNGYVNNADRNGYEKNTYVNTANEKNGYVVVAEKNGCVKGADTNGYTNGYSKSSEVINSYGKFESRSKTSYNNGYNGQLSNSSALCNGSTGGSHQSTPSSSPDNQDNVDSRDLRSQNGNDGSSEDEVPDYLKKYTVINSAEQRAHYKADFNAEYDEYRKLHAIIDSVSKRFALLEERLRNCEDGSDESKKIKDQILREYKENKRNETYQDAKKRFNFLHQKLAHIKKLVIGYDNAYVCDS